MAKSKEDIEREQEKIWIEKMSKMKFPPVGANKKFLLSCEGKPFAGYNTRKEVESARDHYSKNVRGATNPSSNSKMNWTISEQ